MAGKREREKCDEDVQKISDLLAREYQRFHPSAKIDVHRRNSVSIHVRIIDPDFHGMNHVERDRPISRLLEKLPETIETQITVLLLLTPKETKQSFANLEFEHPVPSTI